MPLPYQPVVNVAQVDVRYVWAGQQIENTFHVKNAGGWTLTSLAVLEAAIDDWRKANIQPITAVALEASEVVVTDLTTASAPQITTAAGSPTAGAIGTNSVPNNVTLCIKWETNLRGRSFRGRTYHPGMGVGQVLDSTVADIPAGNILDAYASLITAVSAIPSCELVVVSRVQGGVRLAAGVATPIVGAALVDQTVDSQRRRLPGRGR